MNISSEVEDVRQGDRDDSLGVGSRCVLDGRLSVSFTLKSRVSLSVGAIDRRARGLQTPPGEKKKRPAASTGELEAATDAIYGIVCLAYLLVTRLVRDGLVTHALSLSVCLTYAR